MEKERYREEQRERDKKHLDEKVARWEKIPTSIYNLPLPSQAWPYLDEIDEMYINGSFVGVIVLCAAVAENMLRSQIVSNIRANVKGKKAQSLNFDKLVILNREFGIINDIEKNQLDELRELRNELIHSKEDKLALRTRNKYSQLSLDTDSSYANLYMAAKREAIEPDALKYLLLIRNLTVRFYSTGI